MATNTVVQDADETTNVIEIRDLNVYYGDFHAVGDVTFDVPKNRITALIGPSGCGKSTVLRCINRMNDLIPTAKVDGDDQLPRLQHPAARSRSGQCSTTDWHGLPETEPVPEEHL